jgi:hypothetical protein
MEHTTAFNSVFRLSVQIEEGIANMEAIRDRYSLSDRQMVAVQDLINSLKECEKHADYMVAII